MAPLDVVVPATQIFGFETCTSLASDEEKQVMQELGMLIVNLQGGPVWSSWSQYRFFITWNIDAQHKPYVESIDGTLDKVTYQIEFKEHKMQYTGLTNCDQIRVLISRIRHVADKFNTLAITIIPFEYVHSDLVNQLANKLWHTIWAAPTAPLPFVVKWFINTYTYESSNQECNENRVQMSIGNITGDAPQQFRIRTIGLGALFELDLLATKMHYSFTDNNNYGNYSVPDDKIYLYPGSCGYTVLPESSFNKRWAMDYQHEREVGNFLQALIDSCKT